MTTMQCVQCAVAAVCGCALLLAHQHQRPCPASISGPAACMACPQQGAAATRWCNCKSIAGAMATVQCMQGGKVSIDKVQGQQGQGASSQSAPADAAGTRSASWPGLPRPTGSSATCGEAKRLRIRTKRLEWSIALTARTRDYEGTDAAVDRGEAKAEWAGMDRTAEGSGGAGQSQCREAKEGAGRAGEVGSAHRSGGVQRTRW